LYELNEGCPLFPQVTTLRDILVFLERTIGKIDWEFSNTLRKVQPDLFLDPLKNELRPPLPEDTNTTEIRAASHLLVRIFPLSFLKPLCCCEELRNNKEF